MNRADQRKFHVIYKTTCVETGKYYIGMHSTDDINDGYLGSGSILSRSVKKYGREKHVYEILEFLPDRKSLGLREEEIITDELRSDPRCMNIRNGGTGNPPGKTFKDESKQKLSASMKLVWAIRKENGYRLPKQSEEHIAKRVAKNSGKTRNADTKKRMSASQTASYSSMSAEKKEERGKNISKANSKTWIVGLESGAEIVVTNLRTFAKEKGLPESPFYKTKKNGKYVNGYRVLRLG